MFTLIATILIVYLFWLVVQPWLARYARRKMEQKVRDMFREQFGMNFDGADARRSEPEPSEQRTKIFTADVGEYVEFTETDAPMPAPDVPSGYTPREPQVTDADWEEI